MYSFTPLVSPSVYATRRLFPEATGKQKKRKRKSRRPAEVWNLRTFTLLSCANHSVSTQKTCLFDKLNLGGIWITCSSETIVLIFVVLLRLHYAVLAPPYVSLFATSRAVTGKPAVKNLYLQLANSVRQRLSPRLLSRSLSAVLSKEIVSFICFVYIFTCFSIEKK